MEQQNTKNSTSEIQAEVVPVRILIKEEHLQIPTYQRPYSWEEKNVRQLLEDIHVSKNTGKKKYRIGSVILHNNMEDGSLDIVDGQQRLTTIYLLWKVCGDFDGYVYSCPLKFSSESYESLKNNYTFIHEWLEENVGHEKESYIKYVFDACDFVKIVVEDLTEAFQMFDSQNGRGKDLEAYNLLKAYHIRAMEMESREEKIRCDKRWEDHIDEFKGFTIDKNHPAMFPYQNPQLLQYLTAKFYDTIISGIAATKNRFEYGDNDHINPFVNVNQQIVNGKDFFDYVETYVEIYKQMFINIGTYQLSEFKEFYYTHCLNYNWDKQSYSVVKEKRKTDMAFNSIWPASRTGDSYLRETYKSLVFVLFDKFGERGLKRYYRPLYRLIYSNRLTKSQVKYNFVSSLPSKYFRIIVEAKDLADLVELEKLAQQITIELGNGKINNEQITNFIINGKYGD